MAVQDRQSVLFFCKRSAIVSTSEQSEVGQPILANIITESTTLTSGIWLLDWPAKLDELVYKPFLLHEPAILDLVWQDPRSKTVWLYWALKTATFCAGSVGYYLFVGSPCPQTHPAVFCTLRSPVSVDRLSLYLPSWTNPSTDRIFLSVPFDSLR